MVCVRARIRTHKQVQAHTLRENNRRRQGRRQMLQRYRVQQLGVILRHTHSTAGSYILQNRGRWTDSLLRDSPVSVWRAGHASSASGSANAHVLH